MMSKKSKHESQGDSTADGFDAAVATTEATEETQGVTASTPPDMATASNGKRKPDRSIPVRYYICKMTEGASVPTVLTVCKSARAAAKWLNANAGLLKMLPGRTMAIKGKERPDLSAAS